MTDMVIEDRTVSTEDRNAYPHFYGGREIISKSVTHIVEEITCTSEKSKLGCIDMESQG